jgi:hypothetical protein
MTCAVTAQTVCFSSSVPEDLSRVNCKYVRLNSKNNDSISQGSYQEQKAS